MSVAEAWAGSVALRVVLILIGGALSIIAPLMVAAVIGIWNLHADVRENTTQIRLFQASVEIHDERLRVLERHSGWPAE